MLRVNAEELLAIRGKEALYPKAVRALEKKLSMQY